jgi:regulator of protease activity HflC (stomatin/prohibitin superfamily)
MFDRLISFLIELKDDVIPFKVVNEWESGVRMRGGKFNKNVEAGIRFKIPFLDKIYTCYNITRTLHPHAQTLTTLDQKSIVLKSIIRFHVEDAKTYLLTLNTASDVLIDTTQGIIKETIETLNWKDLNEVDDLITEKTREMVKKWGINIERVTLTDLGLVRTYRLMSDKEILN